MSDRGVYRLAGAMLLQAIQDAGSNSVGRRSSALRWMHSRDDSGFSFPFVCRVLNRDPDRVREFCNRRAAQRRSFRLHNDPFFSDTHLMSYAHYGLS